MMKELKAFRTYIKLSDKYKKEIWVKKTNYKLIKLNAQTGRIKKKTDKDFIKLNKKML
jgi:hypothetical protein